MSERKWELTDDAEFDAAVRDSLPSPPPEDIVRAVTPWRRAVDRALTGMALNAVTLNFLCLNYILPAIGLVLTLLGFRALRRENGWFRGCFILAAAKALLFFPSLILNATIYRSAVCDGGLNGFLTAAGLALTLAQFVCLWRGLKAVKAKAGLPAQAGAAAALIVWNLVIAALALSGYGGTVAVIIMAASYILIIRGVFRTSAELDEAGYAVAAAPVRISDRALAGAIAGVLAAGIICGYLFCGGYRMDWTPKDNAETARVAEIKAELLGLGFPENVLDDLADEEILDCEGAARVVVMVTDEPVNSGREAVEYEDGTEYHTTVYDVKELRITGVAVELPGEMETWKIIHHFRWTVDSGFRGTESIQLWTAERNGECWETVGDVTGRVLCTVDGTECCAPFYSLGSRMFTSSSVFWGEQTATDVFAEFSLPDSGENQRGYVTYTVASGSGDTAAMISSWINYTHQTGLLQYPVKTAAEERMSGSWSDRYPFITVQNALQFYSSGEETDIGAAE